MKTKWNDRVRIKNYTKALNGKIGTVSYRGGASVYVFPDCPCPGNEKYPLKLCDNKLDLLRS